MGIPDFEFDRLRLVLTTIDARILRSSSDSSNRGRKRLSGNNSTAINKRNQYRVSLVYASAISNL